MSRKGNNPADEYKELTEEEWYKFFGLLCQSRGPRAPSKTKTKLSPPRSYRRGSLTETADEDKKAPPPSKKPIPPPPRPSSSPSPSRIAFSLRMPDFYVDAHKTLTLEKWSTVQGRDYTHDALSFDEKKGILSVPEGKEGIYMLQVSALTLGASDWFVRGSMTLELTLGSATSKDEKVLEYAAVVPAGTFIHAHHNLPKAQAALGSLSLFALPLLSAGDTVKLVLRNRNPQRLLVRNLRYSLTFLRALAP